MILPLVLAGLASPVSGDPQAGITAIKGSTELGAAAEVALADAVKGAKVVMLGETTHGDGTSFEIKVEIVKFLHQKQGFDVLIWESGLYDCWVMDRKMGGSDPLDRVAELGVFPHWSQSKESFPVFEYSRSTRSTPRPLLMAGFDLQDSGRASLSKVQEMASWFGDHPSWQRADREALQAAVKAIESAKSQEEWQAASANHLQLGDRAWSVYREGKSHWDKAWGTEAPFRVKVLENAVAFGRMIRMHADFQAGKSPMSEGYNLRERMNAENILWLADGPYRGKKLIVWAHNSHISRGAGNEWLPEPPPKGQLDSTGRIVGKELKDCLVSIGFLAYSGKWSWLGGPPSDFDPAPLQSLEDLLHRQNQPLSFLNMRLHRSQPNSPFGGVLLASPNRQGPFVSSANWSKNFDGVVFIDEMKPRTELKPN